MTQPPPKKSAGRDINALKERLRPKTGSNPAAPAAPAPRAAGGGVLPPPGLDIPPPPGVATQAAPAGPALPDAATDPFAHMNAMAQIGAAQRAPEIVIVNDGKPVETVATHHRAAAIAKVAAICLVPLVIGIAVSSISKDAHAYNSGIKGARFILADVTQMKKNLGALQDQIAAASKGDLTGRDITATLAKFDKIEVRDELIFKAKENSLSADLSGRVLSFYAATKELKQMIDDHVKWAKNDDLALGVARTAETSLTLPAKELQAAVKYRYAVMIWNPTPDEQRSDTAEPGARLVEVGPPYCGSDPTPSTTGTCPPDKPVSGLAVRYQPGGNWFKGDFAIGLPPGDPVPSKKIFPMSANPNLEALAMTPQGAAAELAYRKRLQHINEKLAEAIDLGNQLIDKLKPKANEHEHFTFFM
ncbi:MAG TPA: hypothetical protein VHE35_10465 [Kofleriaceae bacterium]|nr:hypothetical protein [Kofleriaceae bacterium]